ncbi:response regulator [Alicyclobacillus macrosporangiidus]|jgi:two-component system response regulator DegU|uniref:Two-component system, NarL family, response regulator DegU n=1 Tax=Alicyclobacillus macrosporangiidus TaxID=392015 RepID=A0A1I7IIE8_9BACL|nr:response regulator transcription factor [Alicyclobacillus macrosporangiidus]SFU72681.1 two-component system, NarL family, response regulator DegU [Alicyclobacillus macrosporangiidus]
MTEPIRVAIADDNENFRETLREVLEYEPDLQIVGVWRHGADVLLGLEEVRPDVLLLDINMPFLNGVETTKQLQVRYPEVRIIILTMHDDEGYVLETLKSGASGYLVKDGSVSEVVRAIREVAAGRAVVHPQVTHTVIAQFQERAEMSESWRGLLTEREMDILRELANGKTNEEIATALNITTKTVKNHISSIFNKLHVQDRTQAVVLAMKKHWLPS